MSDIPLKLSSAPASTETGFEHRAAGSCSVAKCMSENPDWISGLRDLICQLNVVKIQKQEISNTIGITVSLDSLKLSTNRETYEKTQCSLSIRYRESAGFPIICSFFFKFFMD